MSSAHFPLRWESTGDQWWFASPIDLAAANGHYDVVRELLYIDPNLLIKLTSLPRIRRLESVWDDDLKRSDVARCRAHVARNLLIECQIGDHNSLIGGGYGGWLLYSAAAAGDFDLVKELLGRDPALVFGEGEYGVTDMLYAAARSRNREVFGAIFDCCVKEASSGFKSEMMNRAVHAAARGGDLEMLKELLSVDADVLGFRDALGSTVLHTASARGQLEVVEHLISSYNIITAVDNSGNTALNTASYRGHLPVVELLISTNPSLTSLSNNNGDTFLHMAISGFLAPGFRRLDRQLDLIKRLADGSLIDLQDIVNAQNNQGRTALHMAVVENIKLNVVDLLMSVRYIDLNIRDIEGNTPLDLLKQRPHSEVLIKRLISAGGISNCGDRKTRNALVSHLRKRDTGGSPGTSFRIPDAEIFLYAGGCDFTSTECGYSGEIVEDDHKVSRFSPWRIQKFKLGGEIGKKKDGNKDNISDDCSMRSSKSRGAIPLRLQFSRASSLPYNRRLEAYTHPSPGTKKKFTAGLSQGVLHLLPKAYLGSPSGGSSVSSPVSADRRSGNSASQSPSFKKRASLKMRSMNSYLCFGAPGLAIEESQAQNGERLVA